MGWGFKNGNQGFFKATLIIQANANVSVSVVSSRASYSGTTDANGLLTLSISKKATYRITSSVNSAGVSLSIDKSGKTYTADIVTVGALQAFAVDTWSSNTACCYWTAPESLFTGVYIRRGTAEYPSTESGAEVYRGTGESLALTSDQTVTGCKDSGLTADTAYLYSAWAYLVINGKTYYGARLTATYNAISLVGTVLTITSTRSWVVPAGWRSVKVFCVGGGGSGAAQGGYIAGGGGGGGYTRTDTLDLIPGETHACVIGSGGAAVGQSSGGEEAEYVGGNAGGSTQFDALIARGGGGAPRCTNVGAALSGGSGGSGGGGGALYSSSSISTKSASAGAGGSNGGSGSNATPTAGNPARGGTGQGTTTRAFGEADGTLFAGGGGGGGVTPSYPSANGGAGGGGRGGTKNSGSSTLYITPTPGTPNTGGGGGGAAGLTTSSGATYYSGAGGSGVILLKCLS